MNGSELLKVNDEDLGIIIGRDLKPNKLCSEVLENVNILIGYIGSTFQFKSQEVVLKICNALMFNMNIALNNGNRITEKA